MRQVGLPPDRRRKKRSMASVRAVPLPASERAFFEPRFGRDLSGIRIHTGSRADTASRAINARAFSLGNDIAFASGQYQPGTHSGRTLMAHEITHAFQGNTEHDQHIRRKSNLADVNEKLRYFDVPEQEVIDLIKKLTPSEAAMFILHLNNQDLMTSALDNREMYEAMFHIAGVDLHSRLKWMIEEGTSADFIAHVINQRPVSELSLVQNDPDMMSEVEDLLGKDLAKQILGRKSVCGPDITKQLYDVVAQTGTDFAGWDKKEKQGRCAALISFDTGAFSWDIYELYKGSNSWILNYRPQCATKKSKPGWSFAAAPFRSKTNVITQDHPIILFSGK